MVMLTSDQAIEVLENRLTLGDLESTVDLTSDDSTKTADGQATHTVDVWLLDSTAVARENNLYGQRAWHHFPSHDEARVWFEQVTADHS